MHLEKENGLLLEGSCMSKFEVLGHGLVASTTVSLDLSAGCGTVVHSLPPFLRFPPLGVTMSFTF